MAFVRQNRCSVLVTALCVLILINPFLMGSVIGTTLIAASLLSVLILAVWALRVRPSLIWGLAALAFLALDAMVADRVAQVPVRPVALAITAVFMAAVTISLLFYVLDRQPITTDKVFGAVAAYILIAFSFASLFGLLQVFEPDAFNVAIARGTGGKLNWPDLMYFSFTVLTSTGFGEITPATNMARALIIIEQVLGVMYVAFLVARLANLYGTRPRL